MEFQKTKTGKFSFKQLNKKMQNKIDNINLSENDLVKLDNSTSMYSLDSYIIIFKKENSKLLLIDILHKELVKNVLNMINKQNEVN